MKTEIVHSSQFDNHDNPGHPENSSRTRIMMKSLQNAPFYDDLTFIKPVLIPEELLYRIHSQRMIQQIQEISETMNAWLDLDTYVCKNDFDTARLAAGGCIRLSLDVIEGKADNGFALIRPPGHHATSATSMGFCLFNNAALTAHVLVQKGYRVFIFDPDVHHGNGTQDIFYPSDKVLYQSFHLSPHFPGTGDTDELGRGKGKGYTINAPLSHGNGEEAVTALMDQIFLPIAEEFNPDFIIISSGFDAHHTDRLGGLAITANFFGTLIRRVQEIQPKIICTLEGGYSLDWIGKCLNSQIGVLCNHPVSYEDSITERNTVKPIIKKLRSLLKPYWALNKK